LPFLEDLIKPFNLSINQLAREIDVPAGRRSEIVNGKRAIAADTALRLGRFFGVPPEIRTGLHADRYRFYLLLQEGTERFGHRSHAFCPMTNHVHLVVQVADNPLSTIFKSQSLTPHMPLFIVPLRPQLPIALLALYSHVLRSRPSCPDFGLLLRQLNITTLMWGHGAVPRLGEARLAPTIDMFNCLRNNGPGFSWINKALITMIYPL